MNGKLLYPSNVPSKFEKMLLQQLRYVGNTIPYFRAQNCDDGRPLEDFPLTFKPQIRNDYESFISNDFCHVRQRLANFLNSEPRHTFADGSWDEECHFDRDIVVGDTTGTSG